RLPTNPLLEVSRIILSTLSCKQVSVTVWRNPDKWLECNFLGISRSSDHHSIPMKLFGIALRIGLDENYSLHSSRDNVLCANMARKSGTIQSRVLKGFS